MAKYALRAWIFLHILAGEFQANAWGFFGHREINKHAVFTLPLPLLSFYKHYIHFITEHAVNPDKRRGVVPGEAQRHYIDLDCYDLSSGLSKYWHQALAEHTLETVEQHGILPWHLYRTKQALTRAFQEKNLHRILQLSADLGHYIADANVPLHTCENYNGQLTRQEGIHGFWESRLPELFFENYDFLVGPAQYVEDPQAAAWRAILEAHALVDDVLKTEQAISTQVPSHQQYSFEPRGASVQKVYAAAYAQRYDALLKGQVEKQMRRSVKMVGDFWLTCWIDAGEPDVASLCTTRASAVPSAVADLDDIDLSKTGENCVGGVALEEDPS